MQGRLQLMWPCEFVNLSVCVGVLNQILSNCRLNLVRNLIICSLNLAKFKFHCSNLIVLLSLAKALCQMFFANVFTASVFI